jgi:Dolichyl-phosphate-mannose-protein mannosyltransferase
VIETTPDHYGLPARPIRSSQLQLRYVCYAALLLTIAFFGWIRFHLRNVPLERDEGEYAYVGQLMLHGIPPYQLACNMKLPGTCAAYAVMMAIFGQTSAGIHIGMIFVNAAATILIFLLAKYLYSEVAGAVAAVTYAFLSIRPALLALDAHATHFVVFWALAGILLLLRAIGSSNVASSTNGRANARRNPTWLFFSSGLCFGLAFLMKQPGIFFGIFAGFYWLWGEWKGPHSWRNLAIRSGALAAGTASPFALTCLLLLRSGVFHNFWFWTWSYAREYGSIASWPVAWHLFRIVFPWVIRPFAIWEITITGLTAPLWSRHARAHAGFVTSFFLFSCLAVCPGFYFRQHYFILLLPAAALCTAVAVEAARELLLEQQALQARVSRRFAALIPLLPVLYFAVVFVVSVRSQYREFFRLPPVTLSRKMHTNQPYSEAVAVADYIKANSSPQDQIGILGSEPEICFYAARHCATSYIYMYPILERQKFAPQMRADMMRQIERAHPRFLVYVDSELSWWAQDPAPGEDQSFFDRAWNYAHTGYELVDQVPIAGNGKHLWGSQSAIYVFRHNEP